MNNWENNKVILNELGVLGGQVPNDVLTWLKKIISKDRHENMRYNKSLAGHIKDEFLIRCEYRNVGIVEKNDIGYTNYNNYVVKMCFNKFFERFWDKYIILSEPRNLEIQSTWINYQKKYEFNPPHHHTGIFSWVIFMKIPYNLEDEVNYFTTAFENDHTSKFGFICLNPSQSNISINGGINIEYLDVDKSYENKIILFPSNMIHFVHPFYTSNEERITISGNVHFKV